MNKTLISLDVHSTFGHLKKNDINEGIYLTYTYLHKPALLGILGSIVGLGGYSQVLDRLPQAKKKSNKEITLPEYFQKLNHIKVSIMPLTLNDNTFMKTVIGYNNAVGYANADGGILQVKEQTLVRPSYRIFLELDKENNLERSLYDNIMNFNCEFIPYMGKNDFTLWWDNVASYDYALLNENHGINISSLFVRRKDISVREMREKQTFNWEILEIDDEPTYRKFMFIESLPIGYDNFTGHYTLEQFVYTNYQLKLRDDTKPVNLYELSKNDYQTVIQLF